MADSIQQDQAANELDESYDTSDPKAVNTARKKSARTRADRLQFIQAAMLHEQGRAWYYDILKRCHIFNQPYVIGDPHGTSFKCGELNIGIQILADIQDAAPDKYILMVTENKTKNG